MPSLDTKKITVQIKTGSLGDVKLRYVSGGDIKQYFGIKKNKDLSDKKFVLKILYNQLLSPKIDFDKFQKIEDVEIIKIGNAFIKIEDSLFEKHQDTGNFFKDFKDTINKYLDKDIKQKEKFMEPFKKDAEKSFEKVYKTIKSIQNIVPEINFPDLSKFNKPVESKSLLLKSSKIVREENNWQKHKELLDSLESSLEIQKRILSGQKSGNSLNIKWAIIVMIMMLIPSCIAAYYGYKGFDLQSKTQKGNLINQEYPFFKYSYDSNEKMFRISSYDYVRINKVQWALPEYKDNRIHLHTINSLTKDLSWYEIRDYFARKLSSKISTERDFKFIQDDVECLFFMYAQQGIPVVVEINYDFREKQDVKSRDLIIIDRLDTEFSSIKFIDKVEEDDSLKSLLDQSKSNINYAYDPTIEMVNKMKEDASSKVDSGKCRIRFDQPNQGF